MRRLARHIVNLFAFLSLILLVLVVRLWVRSASCADCVAFRTGETSFGWCVSNRGTGSIAFVFDWLDPIPKHWTSADENPWFDAPGYPDLSGVSDQDAAYYYREWPGTASAWWVHPIMQEPLERGKPIVIRGTPVWGVTLHYWVPAVATAILPAIVAGRRVRRLLSERRRRASGPASQGDKTLGGGIAN